MSIIADFDKLQQAFNVACEYAAKNLADMIGVSLPSSRIETILISDIETVNSDTLSLLSEKFGVVSLDCSGVLNAQILLLFDVDSKTRILQKMMGEEADEEMLLECENEAMCELGNIMINGYLSSIADFLNAPLESMLPVYAIQSKDDLVTIIKTAKNFNSVFVSSMELPVDENVIGGKLLFLANFS